MFGRLLTWMFGQRVYEVPSAGPRYLLRLPGWWSEKRRRAVWDEITLQLASRAWVSLPPHCSLLLLPSRKASTSSSLPS